METKHTSQTSGIEIFGASLMIASMVIVYVTAPWIVQVVVL